MLIKSSYARLFFGLFITLLGFRAYAVECDCSVVVYSPTTGLNPHSPVTLEKYELETYGKVSVSSELSCRKSCLQKFQDEMPTQRLNALLINHSKSLIEERLIGFNCTGLTTLKYPVRVKANLGKVGLGNVLDLIQAVNLEHSCH